MTCSIEGCMKQRDKRGWCGMHYRRWQRHGDPLFERPPRTHKSYRRLVVADPDYNRRNYWKNPQKSRSDKRADYEKHRAKRLAASRERLASDPEYKARFRAWQLASNRKRRRRLGGKTLPGVPRMAIRQKMAYWGNRCWVCGGPEEHVDHVKPIAKGGPHMLCNLRPICASCNVRKSARWPFDPNLIRSAA